MGRINVKRWVGTRISYLVGADAVLDLQRWHNTVQV